MNIVIPRPVINQNIENSQSNLIKVIRPQAFRPSQESVFKVPLPRKPTINQVQNNVQYQQQQQQQVMLHWNPLTIGQQQYVIAQVPQPTSQRLSFSDQQKMLAYKAYLQRKAAEEQYREYVKQVKLQRMVIRKKNSLNFLIRMKQYSKLPQYANAIFNIPKELALLDQKILSSEEIDQFIQINDLIIVKKIDVEDHIMNFEEDESTKSETSVEDQLQQTSTDNFENIKSLSTIKQVKLIEFKVPQSYLNGEFNEKEWDLNNQINQENKYKIGAYTLSQRAKRILHYKMKQTKRRSSKPITKKFSGRSKVATQKLRINGKFVKKSEQISQ
eukprot:403352145